jgi:hypothetical protein
VIHVFHKWPLKDTAEIRLNFAQNAKRTWNKIKMNASLPTTYHSQVFANHYRQNWVNTPPLRVESYDSFTQHSSVKLQLNKRGLIDYLTNINKIKEVIKLKGNLSAMAWIN